MEKNILEYGAQAGSNKPCTQAIQKALDESSANGGGIVIIPKGIFLTGTLIMRSNIELHLETGAILQGSGNIEDFPVYKTEINPDNHKDLQPHHLLIADNVENIRITGGGIIDGNGPSFWNPPKANKFYKEKEKRPSPMLELRNCQNVVLQDFTIRNSPGWTVHGNGCKNLYITRLQIENDLYGPNTDGIDISDCQDVFITGCRISCGDDAIVLKSLGGINERITVSDCILQTNCSALKLGASESYGTIRQVTFSNCVIHRSSRGISLYCLTGGLFEDVQFNNIIMDCNTDMKLACPIHINCSHHPDPNRKQKIGKIRNIRISDCLVKTNTRILLTCEDNEYLENIMLRDIHLEYPEVEDEFKLASQVVAMQFSPFSPEARSAKAAVAVSNVKGLVLQNIAVSWPAHPAVPMHFLYARKTQGMVQCPLGNSSQEGLKKHVLAESPNLHILDSN